MTSPLEYGQRVQEELREQIRDVLRERGAAVRSLAALTKALGQGDNRQYIASRFAVDPVSGKIRDLTVGDVIAIGRAIGVPGDELLRRAREIVDGDGAGSGTVEPEPTGPNLPTLAQVRASRQAPTIVKRAARPKNQEK